MQSLLGGSDAGVEVLEDPLWWLSFAPTSGSGLLVEAPKEAHFWDVLSLAAVGLIALKMSVILQRPDLF